MELVNAKTVRTEPKVRRRFGRTIRSWAADFWEIANGERRRGLRIAEELERDRFEVYRLHVKDFGRVGSLTVDLERGYIERTYPSEAEGRKLVGKSDDGKKILYNECKKPNHILSWFKDGKFRKYEQIVFISGELGEFPLKQLFRVTRKSHSLG